MYSYRTKLKGKNMKKIKIQTEKWCKQDILDYLASNEKANIKALMLIYSNQTSDEQKIGCNKVYNKIGFTGVDAVILSSMAKFYKETGFLTPKQLEVVKKKMPKYAKQLTEISNQKANNNGVYHVQYV